MPEPPVVVRPRFAGAAGEPPTTYFKLTTYNVLLDGLEAENSRKTPWSKRLQLLADKINEVEADVLCSLQEVNQAML